MIVEQGIGGPSIDWNEINDRMSRITTVCDYDRAGMGYSEPAQVLSRAVRVAAVGEIEGQYAETSLAEPDKRRLIAIFQKSHTYRTLVDEGAGLELDLARAAAPPGLGDLPVIVIAEGKPAHPYMQENLLRWH